MDLLNGVVQTGLVCAVVFIIQFVKKWVDKKRKEQAKTKITSDVWYLMVLLCGIPMTLIVYGMDSFINFNFFAFIKDSFLYSAASAFVYKTYSISKSRLLGDK